jgi:diadenosine tetraphosphate (Ap4A) HIT family hydrolase
MADQSSSCELCARDVHVHLIPRYAGDVPDPRGGVRCVLAGRRPPA